jgi:hypothetical protein
LEGCTFEGLTGVLFRFDIGRFGLGNLSIRQIITLRLPSLDRRINPASSNSFRVLRMALSLTDNFSASQEVEAKQPADRF